MTVSITLFDATKATGQRHCGTCTLCCKLLPVRELGKGASERCKHQSHAKGCAVYANLARVSPSCKLWSCRWLLDDAGNTRRPDRVHYVIDCLPDFITACDDDTGETYEVPVVQIWCDAGYPDAHRDPALRAWLELNQMIALVRYNDKEAFVLFPPSRISHGQWLEHRTSIGSGHHHLAEVARVLSEQGSP